MSPFSLEIVTPEAPFLREDVDSVQVKGADGHFEVLTGHAPLMARLVPGKLRIRKGNQRRQFRTGEGLMDVSSAAPRQSGPAAAGLQRTSQVVILLASIAEDTGAPEPADEAKPR